MTKKKIIQLAYNAAFRELLSQQSEHKKVKLIKYEELLLQPYMSCVFFLKKMKQQLSQH